MRHHRRQPTRFPCPWDSPSKNTGLGYHFLLQCIKVKMKSLSRVRLWQTPWIAAYQAPPSMGFSRQEYWSGVLFYFTAKFIEKFYSKMKISQFKVVAHEEIKLLHSSLWKNLESFNIPYSIYTIVLLSINKQIALFRIYPWCKDSELCMKIR